MWRARLTRSIRGRNTTASQQERTMTPAQTPRTHRRRDRMMARAAIALLSAGGGLGVAAAPAAAATTSTAVKIGIVLPLSGSSATAGQAAEHGAQLAVQQANSGKLVSGVTFSVTASSDTGAGGSPSGTTGATALKGLISNAQVAGVVAPFDTNTALGELPLANRAPLATVSPSATDTCLTITAALGCVGNELSTVQPTGHTTFFRVAPADALQGGALADFLFKDRTYRSAYVIDDASAAGTGQATTFINGWRVDGGSLTGHASVAPGGASYLSLLTQIAALQPDVVVYTGASTTEGTLLREQMRQVPGLAQTAFAATSGVDNSTFLQAVGTSGGLIFAVAPEPQLAQLASATTFASQYQAKFGTPSTDAARGYDSARALLLAIKAAIAGGAKPPTTAGASATTFRSAVIAALARTTFTGADGPIAFAPSGDVQQGPVEIDQLRAVNGSAAFSPVTLIQVLEPTPSASLTPSPLDFGHVSTQSSSTMTLQLSNTGTVPFGVGSVSVSGSGFALASTTCSTANLAPASQCTIKVRFAPATASTLTGSVKVLDSTGTTLQTAALSGTGVTALALPAAVYVGNGGNSSVRSFRLPLSANQTPATTLAGQSTQLDGTAAVALDAFGNMYVVDSDSESITVYRGNATGNTQPLGVLTGPDTGLANPTAIAIDGQGRIYVANAAANTVTVYAAGATGDAAPIRTIGGLFGPSGVAVDGAGNVWVANSPGNSLELFTPTDTKPSATIVGSATQLDGPQSLTLDAAGNVVVADEYSSAITAYAPTDNGDDAPLYTIAGSATGLDFPVGLDVDSAGNLYVSNVFGNTITVYAATARGDAAPTVTLNGGPAGLASPEHLAVSPPFAVQTRRLPAARVGRHYRARLIAAFGIGSYRWTVRRGRLPRGLRLDRRTGLLSGTPKRAGSFRIRVAVTDGSHPADRAVRSLALVVRRRRRH
jgi:branched-chain amino acid transport system substrate-binding protein